VEVNFVPVVGTVSAEMFACVFEDNTYPLEVLPVPHIKGTKVKALKVSGDCMEPEVHDGEYVVISIGAAPEEGSLVVARVSGECTLKRIYMRGEQVTLKPDNKKYRERVVAKKDLEVLGVVLYTFKKQVPKKR
jgi:SOS-response transcriptional repressor LexA